jgi:hypothetical protein
MTKYYTVVETCFESYGYSTIEQFVTFEKVTNFRKSKK